MSITPIIPGFHPDPSICRVGDRYVLANSSFEYSPGVPVFVSNDLVSWAQVGNALTTSAQFRPTLGVGNASSGIYAPTLRHHAGRYWLTTTNLHEIRRGHLIVSAEDPGGPWSEPVYTAGLIGIDPDLSWDDEGVCHLTWSDVVGGGIAQAPVDPETGAVLGGPRTLWHGTGGAHAEGPHVFKRDDWWYLLVAEGGTGPGHMVTIARSRAISGPYESNPSNPVLTHRSTSDPVQSTGHADIVELADGSWAMVHLGTRPRGSFPRWHTNGRETFLVGIEWHDDWPIVVEDRFTVPESDSSFVDAFDGERLHPRWVSPTGFPSEFVSLTPTGLEMQRGRDASGSVAANLLAARVQDDYWSATLAAQGDVALVARIDDAHQVILERLGTTVRSRIVIGPVAQTVAIRENVPLAARLEIRSVPVDAPRGAPQGPDRIVMGVLDGDFEALAELDGRYLSTEVAGGFTGRVVGFEALGEGTVVTRFDYAGS